MDRIFKLEAMRSLNIAAKMEAAAVAALIIIFPIYYSSAFVSPGNLRLGCMPFSGRRRDGEQSFMWFLNGRAFIALKCFGGRLKNLQRI